MLHDAPLSDESVLDSGLRIRDVDALGWSLPDDLGTKCLSNETNRNHGRPFHVDRNTLQYNLLACNGCIVGSELKANRQTPQFDVNDLEHWVPRDKGSERFSNEPKRNHDNAFDVDRNCIKCLPDIVDHSGLVAYLETDDRPGLVGYRDVGLRTVSRCVCRGYLDDVQPFLREHVHDAERTIRCDAHP